MRAERRLPQKGGHELVSVDLMDPSPHGTPTTLETLLALLELAPRLLAPVDAADAISISCAASLLLRLIVALQFDFYPQLALRLQIDLKRWELALGFCIYMNRLMKFIKYSIKEMRYRL